MLLVSINFELAETIGVFCNTPSEFPLQANYHHSIASSFTNQLQSGEEDQGHVQSTNQLMVGQFGRPFYALVGHYSQLLGCHVIIW